MYSSIVDPLPFDDDLALLVEACHAGFSQRVLDGIRTATDATVRFSDGYVFQHLVGGSKRVTQLADLLGVSQQAASKQIADLESRGLVQRAPDDSDRRATRISLSPIGLRVVHRARAVRAAINDEVEQLLGRREAATLRRQLVKIAATLGSDRILTERRLRPETVR